MQNKKHILATVESDVACYQVDGTAVNRLKILFSQSRDRWCYLGLLDIHRDLIVCILRSIEALCAHHGWEFSWWCLHVVFQRRKHVQLQFQPWQDDRGRWTSPADRAGGIQKSFSHNWIALFWCNRPWDLCSALLHIFVQVYISILIFIWLITYNMNISSVYNSCISFYMYWSCIPLVDFTYNNLIVVCILYVCVGRAPQH